MTEITVRGWELEAGILVLENRRTAFSAGLDSPSEKAVATHSNFLAWEIPNLVGYSPWGRKELDTTEHSTSLKLQVIF